MLIAITVTLHLHGKLDTSIANVALPHIAGGLAVSAEESTWVLTSYLVSSACVRLADSPARGRRLRYEIACQNPGAPLGADGDPQRYVASYVGNCRVPVVP